MWSCACDRVLAGPAREPHVALELDRAAAGRHARLVRGQVPEPAGRGVVVDGDVGQAHDAARRILGGRDRLQPDAQLCRRSRIPRGRRRSGNSPGASRPRPRPPARDRRRATAPAPRSARGARRAGGGARSRRDAPRRQQEIAELAHGARPPAARVTCRAAASTSGCASATAAGRPTAAISPRSGVSSTRQATRRASTALRARSSASASDLSPTPWATSATPSSRMRAVTAAERRPEMTATPTPAATQRLDAVAVAHVERLEALAVRAVPEAPVRQHAVHVEDEQRDIGGRRHITPARSRSCTLSAPTRPAGLVEHEEAVDRVLLHHQDRLGRELVRADRARAARHDVGHGGRVDVEVAVERAAQVAVGEDADDPARRRPRPP